MEQPQATVDFDWEYYCKQLKEKCDMQLEQYKEKCETLEAQNKDLWEKLAKVTEKYERAANDRMHLESILSIENPEWEEEEDY